MSNPGTPEPGRGNVDLRRRMLYVPPETPISDDKSGIADDSTGLAIPGMSPAGSDDPFAAFGPPTHPKATTMAKSPDQHPQNSPADLGNTPLPPLEDMDLDTLRQNYQQLLADYNYAVQVVEEAVRIEEEYKTIKEQNEQLVSELAEVKQALTQRTSELEAQRQQYQAIKSQLEEIERELASGNFPGMPSAPPVPRTEGDLEAMANELEQERIRLVQERRRLEEEKRAFREEQEEDNRQLRQEEARMARERAMMARQEMALKQLNEDIRKQLALLQSGGNAMQETLKQFQRRQIEANARNAGPGASSGQPQPGGPAPAQPTPQQPSTAPKGRDSGLIRRFFGQGGSGK